MLLRLRPDHVRLVPGLTPPRAAALQVPGVPAPLGCAAGRHPIAQLCWRADGRLLLAPAAWALDSAGAVAWLPAVTPRGPRGPVPGALVIEHHHPYRATRMAGVCLRGRLRPDPSAAGIVAARYEGVLPAGTGVRLEVTRVTWWRGFEVRSLWRAAARRTAREPARVR